LLQSPQGFGLGPKQACIATQRRARGCEMSPLFEELAPVPSDGETLTYRGWRFRCSALRQDNGYFKPVVTRLPQVAQGKVSGAEDAQEPKGPDEPEKVEETLPEDTEEIVYASEAEALRHAEQQAIRWVHDRTGTGQAQF
jgi:hypothetical protein